MMKEIASTFPHRRGFHCCGLYKEAMMNAYEQTIRQILQRAEALYEQFGNPLVSARRHRRARAFARAFGATRLAHEFHVPRATIVSARRLAFARWRYWMERYEEPRWQEIASVAGAHTQWEGVVVRYLRVRAVLRQGQLPSDASAFQTNTLIACALRSLASVSWHAHTTACWQSVWRLLAQRHVQQARLLADQLNWSGVQWRRTTRVVSCVAALLWLPLSQRQFLALSTWPPTHLDALRQTGQALFPTQSISLLQLAHCSPTDITRIARPHDQRNPARTPPDAIIPPQTPTAATTWRSICQLFLARRRTAAYAHAHTNGWSARHVRRLQHMSRKLTTLITLPLSLRQCLALSQWPTPRLQELRLHGVTLIGTQRFTTAMLVRLPPRILSNAVPNQEVQA